MAQNKELIVFRECIKTASVNVWCTKDLLGVHTVEG